MPRVSREEQIRMGIVEPTVWEEKNFVAAGATDLAPSPSTELSPIEGAIVDRGHSLAGQIMQSGNHSGHLRIAGDPVTLEKANLLSTAPIVIAIAMIVTGLILLAGLFGLFGAGLGNYFVAWLAIFGVAGLIALVWNRRITHWNSAAGVAHHELDAKADVAKYAIDRHVELLERKWGLR